MSVHDTTCQEFKILDFPNFHISLFALVRFPRIIIMLKSNHSSPLPEIVSKELSRVVDKYTRLKVNKRENVHEARTLFETRNKYFKHTQT